MPTHSDRSLDPAAASVSLTAEAALLESRLRMLQEALATVDTRIREVSETLRRLRGPASPPEAGESRARGGPSLVDGAAAGPDGGCPEGPHHSLPYRP